MRQLTQEQLRDELSDPIFRLIGETADSLGLECHLVGGYVRDLYLQRPTADIDCLVVGSGIQVAQALQQRLGRGATLSVFRRFGTAQVKWHGREVEFVGARRESYSPDSRKPHVEDGTLADDLSRRDFTVNALALCLNAQHFAQLTDLFCGLDDMRDRLLATPLDPDTTFSDDPLRMMRAVRFASQLRFQIEEETQEAMRRNAHRLAIVSQERITDELNKVMLSDCPSIGLVEMDRADLLRHVLPELCLMQGVERRRGRAHKDIFYHSLQVLDNTARRSPDLWLRWAALLHDVGKPRSKRWEEQAGWTFRNHNAIGASMVPAIFRRLKLPTDQRMDYVQQLVALHMRPIAIADSQVTDSAVRRLLFEAGGHIDDLMTLAEADITSANHEARQRFLANFRLVRQKIADLQERDNYRTWKNPISGQEVMQALSLPPCPLVGQLKQAVKDAIWEGRIPNTHDDAYRYMLSQAKLLVSSTPAQPTAQEGGA